MLKSIKQLFGQKLFNCPNCKQRIRVPVKRGKTLRVTCPMCKASYDLSFVNPIGQLLSRKLKFSDLQRQEKKQLILLLVCVVLVAYMLITTFMMPATLPH